MPNDAVLRCTTCGLPWARVTNAVLVVESRHHGQRHVNAIPLVQLAALVNGGTALPAYFAAEVQPEDGP